MQFFLSLVHILRNRCRTISTCFQGQNSKLFHLSLSFQRQTSVRTDCISSSSSLSLSLLLSLSLSFQRQAIVRTAFVLPRPAASIPFLSALPLLPTGTKSSANKGRPFHYFQAGTSNPHFPLSPPISLSFFTSHSPTHQLLGWKLLGTMKGDSSLF